MRQHRVEYLEFSPRRYDEITVTAPNQIEAAAIAKDQLKTKFGASFRLISVITQTSSNTPTTENAKCHSA